MRFVIALVLGGALALSGCDSDEGSSGTGGSGGAGGMGGGEAPVIEMVAWAPDGACTPGMASDFTVTVTATDADSNPMDLVYAGSVQICTGDIDQATSVINCPNNNPYGGSVVVSDADGNNSAEVSFTIGVCETGSTP